MCGSCDPNQPTDQTQTGAPATDMTGSVSQAPIAGVPESTPAQSPVMPEPIGVETLTQPEPVTDIQEVPAAPTGEVNPSVEAPVVPGDTAAGSEDNPETVGEQPG